MSCMLDGREGTRCEVTHVRRHVERKEFQVALQITMGDLHLAGLVFDRDHSSRNLVTVRNDSWASPAREVFLD